MNDEKDWYVSSESRHVMLCVYEIKVLSPSGNPLYFALDAEKEPGDRGRAEAETNAHLMASAPKLLEALQKIANNWNDLHRKDFNQAKSAIALAKGESS